MGKYAIILSKGDIMCIYKQTVIIYTSNITLA